MSRYKKNMVLLGKIEPTPGVDAAPAAATDGLLIVGDVSFSPLEITYAERNLLMAFFGNSLSLVAMANQKVSFSVELAGSGTAGTAPAWASLIQACAMAQASLTAPARIEYLPVSTGLKSITLYLYDDGLLHKLTGAMGSVKLQFKKGETPKLAFDFLGAYNAPTAVTNVTPTLSAWKVPLPVCKANVSTDITLGCSYATGALSGGTSFNSTGLEVDLGNKTTFISMLSSERCEITDRDVKASFEMELTAAQEVSAYSDMMSNTTTGLGFVLGSAAGSKVMVHAPAIQRTAAKKADQDGLRTNGFDAKFTPVSGNDELRLVLL